MRSMTLGAVRLDAVPMNAAVEKILAWSRAGSARTVCVTNVHGAVEALSPEFQQAINGADLVCVDGVPLVWAARAKGLLLDRIFGADLMVETAKRAEAEGVAVGLLGGTQEIIDAVQQRLKTMFPALRISFAESPPFRPPTTTESDQLRARINASGAAILFIALGCPKQELWMAANKPHLTTVMLGVGWAFELLAGSSKRAPIWAREIGLEWIFRIVEEPGRLGARSLNTIPPFVWLTIRELWSTHILARGAGITEDDR